MGPPTMRRFSCRDCRKDLFVETTKDVSRFEGSDRKVLVRLTGEEGHE